MALSLDSCVQGEAFLLRSRSMAALLAILLIFNLLSGKVVGDLTGNDAVILVNAGSPTSGYIAEMYRQYHPDLPLEHVIMLHGLADCSGPNSTPADEILTRQEYEELIAAPVRVFLLDPDHPERIEQIKLIITTAGMPYRITSTKAAFASALYPAGSNPWTVSNNTQQIDCASVESELTCLWYSDCGDNCFGIDNRIVNPYHGYRASSISLFERHTPGEKQMNWSYAINIIGASPLMEGFLPQAFPPAYGTVDRKFCAGDIFLTCRLDGPKGQGQSAVYAVREMLQRAALASSLYVGINPDEAVALLDDVPSSSLDQNRVCNLDKSVDCWVYQDFSCQPPDAPGVLVRDDYVCSFKRLTSQSVYNDQLNVAMAPMATIVIDRRNGTATNQSDLEILFDQITDGQYLPDIIFYSCFGTNGDEARPSGYLTDGQQALRLSNGAVFTSIESFNAATMFSDVETLPVAQGKIVDFISIGGTNAIGHAFEPVADAIIDNEFLLANLMEDADSDGRADLTFVEATFTAIPFLSWSEVVIGDPLMRIAYGPGGELWKQMPGDTNNDGRINVKDVRNLKAAVGGKLMQYWLENTAQYNDLCDFNRDGSINVKDVRILKGIIAGN